MAEIAANNIAGIIRRVATGESVEPTRANSNVSIQRSQTHNLPMHVALGFTILIPCVVAVINFLMVALDLQLVTFKFDTMERIMNETGSAWVGGAALAGICALYAMGSACLVLFVDPKSAGSGIPESKGYMNGNTMAGFWTVRGLMVRSVGVIFTVAAGFPVGREGPMVGIGGCVGFGVVSLLASPYMRKWVKMDTSDKHGQLSPALVTDEGRFNYALRIGTVLGSSAGIATAFNAPIGGILYMFEEVTVTNWAPETTFKAFIGSVAACFVSQQLMNLLGASAHSLLIFDPDADPTAQKFAAVDWLFVAIAGALVGGLSAFFAKCLALVWTWRRRATAALNSRGRAVAIFAKLFEAMFYGAFCAMVFSVVPSIVACSENHSSGGSGGARVGSAGSASGDHGEHRRLAGLLFRPYVCEDGEHNKIASLLLSGAEGAVKHLFDQTADSYMNPGHLLITFVTYFIMACGMPGLQMPMGCFVPSMLIGALFGRFLGEIFTIFGNGVGLTLASPGVYSMAGAAAMLGGFTHMTLAITALLVEAARDLSLIPMLMLSISVSHLVSTCISHHGYDEVLIMKKGVPYLEAELPHELEHGQTAIDLMDEYPDEVLLPVEAPIDVVETALAISDAIEVFPVLGDDGICLGTVLRSRLEVAIQCHRAPEMGAVQNVEMTGAIQKLVRTPSMTTNGVRIPVHRLMDRCPHTILEDMPVTRFYNMFSLGSVEYAIVVSKHGEFRGVMTRRNLISASSHSYAPDIPKRSVSSSPKKSQSPTKQQVPVLLGNLAPTGVGKPAQSPQNDEVEMDPV